MLAPIAHPYPPPGYGPWERVTHDLTEELVAMGHHVTLFAPEGSKTTADLVATVPGAVASMPGEDPRLLEEEHLGCAMRHVSEGGFDVVHSHHHVHALGYAALLHVPLVSTLHGVAWNRSHHRLLANFKSLPYVSISDSERNFFPGLNYVATVPNGIVTDDFPPGEGGGGYVAFIGRMAPEKAPHLAVEAARRSGRHLLLAGVIEDRHAEYFSFLMKSAGDAADFAGHLDRDELPAFLGGAEALIMPLEWDEPFGLVVVESLACGTPVVAWDRGAMREIIEERKTGFLVSDVGEASTAMEQAPKLSRSRCREAALARFDASIMARGYVEVYETLRTSAR